MHPFWRNSHYIGRLAFSSISAIDANGGEVSRVMDMVFVMPMGEKGYGYWEEVLRVRLGLKGIGFYALALCLSICLSCFASCCIAWLNS